MANESVVEAVARSICAACGENPDHAGDCRGNEFRWQDYRGAALAALEAVGAKTPEPCRETLRDILRPLPQQPQRQDALNDQLRDLRPFAQRLGMYDAADLIRDMVER